MEYESGLPSPETFPGERLINLAPPRLLRASHVGQQNGPESPRRLPPSFLRAWLAFKRRAFISAGTPLSTFRGRLLRSDETQPPARSDRRKKREKRQRIVPSTTNVATWLDAGTCGPPYLQSSSAAARSIRIIEGVENYDYLGLVLQL